MKNLIRNIGGASSPILNRKSHFNVKKLGDSEVPITKRTNVKGRLTSLSKTELINKRSISCDSRLTRKRDSSVDTDRKIKDKIDINYALLTQVNLTFLKLKNCIQLLKLMID